MAKKMGEQIDQIAAKIANKDIKWKDDLNTVLDSKGEFSEPTKEYLQIANQLERRDIMIKDLDEQITELKKKNINKTNMTLIEFNKYAKEALEEYGLNPDRIDVMAGVFNGKDVHYTIQCWDSKTKKHIRSSQPNPSSSLVEFKDKLKAHFKDYSKEVKDIEL